MKRSVKFGSVSSDSNTPHLVGLPYLCLIVVAGLTLVGCGKSSESTEVTAEQVVPVSAEAPPDEQEKVRITQAVAIQRGIEPPPPTMVLKGGELATPEVLAAYNQELLRYMTRTRDVPETLAHIQRASSLPRLPTPPPGKRIVYDDRNRVIKLESK